MLFYIEKNQTSQKRTDRRTTMKKTGRKKYSKKVRAVIAVIVIAVIAVAAYFIYRAVVYTQMSEETAPRESWVTDTGTLLREDEDSSVKIYRDDRQEDMEIYQIVPSDVENENFTYYDPDVQQRLDDTLQALKSEADYSLEEPLAVWNPYGTGSNGLYLYFDAQNAAQVTYQIHTEVAGDIDATDYEAAANAGTSDEKEFLMIGLVPGMENQVTIRLLDKSGKELESRSFTVTVPKPVSGYDVVLKSEAGESAEPLTDGLYYTLGTQGYYGYMFFFDNEGIMRYEMLLDGYKGDRILFDGEEMLCCVASDQIGRINRLGRAVDLYTLEGYTMHHDFNMAQDGHLVVLATKNNTFDGRVMDFVLEVDMETGDVSELLDLRNIFPDYYDKTEKVSDTDPFFWQAGTRDWIHLNTIDYTRDDGLILSSRETSTIIKIGNVHSQPELTYLIGNRDFWEETPYADYVYEKDGDFTGQYGQHTVTVLPDAAPQEGQYYLMMFNNNYYANSTRTDDYEPKLDERVSESLQDEEQHSYVDVYLVDENAKTYELVWEAAVPYSSIVSSVQVFGDHLVVNSGVSHVFGEYDAQGERIRQYAYECSFQGYRVMKDDFAGFWFAD